MRPIHQTVEALTQIGRVTGQVDLLEALQQLSNQVQQCVPDCTGLSLAWTEHGVTFTLVASDEEIAVLDALQYLDGGPCVDAVHGGHGIETGSASPLDEEQWRMFAQATAASGVRSTLTLPLTEEGCVIGSVNMYGASAQAFDGHHEQLAQILGAWAPGAISNADLSFGSRRLAEQAPAALRAQGHIDKAVGFIGVHQGVSTTRALELLQHAATRAGISPEQLAEAILDLRI
jgi:GAF domain-containing protein